MNEALRRSALVAGLIAATGLASWWAWPRPALELRIERGGAGLIVDRWGHTRPLPETIRVTASGRNTRVRIDNRDTTYQTLGIFGATAHSVRGYSIPLPGVYGGYCSAHKDSKQITYVVE